MRPAAAAKLLQGVTTDCTGNCGFSPFPLTGDAMSLRHGTFFEPALADRWPSLAAYAESVDGLRPAINLAPLVGLGAVRLAVLGEDDRAATAAELTEMGRLVDASLAEGGFGISSGLIYAPSGYADVAELAALAEVAAARGRIYATHMRNEGDRLEAAVDEAIEVGRRSGCAIQISHHKAVGEANWGKVTTTLAAIDAANRAGADVSVDVYPYTAGSTTLAALFPAEALAGGEAGLRRGWPIRRRGPRSCAPWRRASTGSPTWCSPARRPHPSCAAGDWSTPRPNAESTPASCCSTSWGRTGWTS